MRWNTTRLLGSAASIVALAATMGVAQARNRNAEGPVQGGYAAMPEEAPRLGDPYEINGKRYEPKDDVTHDEVGFAGIMQGAGAVAIMHRTLPVPSYVELTNLETGKTILARVVDRGPFSNDRVADMSPEAAQLIGASNLTPIRVRRVNPPAAEKAALRNGKAAPARLDTPPALLSALRRRMTETVTPPKDMAEARPAPAASTVAPAKSPPGKRRGADFGNAPVEMAAPVAIEGERKGRFIVERRGRQSAPRPAPEPQMAEAAPPPIEEQAPAPVVHRVPTSGGSWFVQIGSFADQGNAEAMAAAAEAGLAEAGDVWRVRYGPFASRADADAALGQIRNKGYPQARVTR